jgi:hypothetical protein
VRLSTSYHSLDVPVAEGCVERRHVAVPNEYGLEVDLGPLGIKRVLLNDSSTQGRNVMAL